MTPDQIKLVQASFAIVFPIKMAMAQTFYDRLFTIAPQVRPLFPTDMTHQREKLTDMLAYIVRNLGDPTALQQTLTGLARRHVDYKAVPDQFGPVGAALIDALDAHTPGGLNTQSKDAWVAAYTVVVEAMTPLMEGQAA